MDSPGSPDTDVLCSQLKAINLREEEGDRFCRQLSEFPHTFQLTELYNLTNSVLKRLRSGLESALLVGHETSLETARARNLLAYILHRLNKPEDALEQLKIVMNMKDQRDNLVTLANLAVILHDEQMWSRAQEMVDCLRQLQQQKQREEKGQKREEDFEYLVVRAKAELAFTYTRLGPRFSQQAISLFSKVLQLARSTDKWLWSFGMALTRRRQLRFNPQAMSPTPSPEIAAELQDLLTNFLRIAGSSASQKLRAKTYAELAHLLNMVPKSMKRELYSRADMSPKKACEKALVLDPDDNSVLCKSGRIFRYCRDLQRSQELFEKAVRIRPSSTAYHHLGLTYKALATVAKSNETSSAQAYGFYREPTQQATVRGSTGSYRGLSQQFGWERESYRGRSGESVQRRGGPWSGIYQHHPRQPHTGSSWVAGVSETAESRNSSFTSQLSQNSDVRTMQKKLKSPPGEITGFSQNDPYVKEALTSLRKAIEFSEGENAPAGIDLAVLLKRLGKLDEARQILQNILKESKSQFPSDYIRIYEQLGHILKQMADIETDKTKKNHLLRDSQSVMMLALKIASRLYIKTPGIQKHMEEVFLSFHILLREVEKSDNPRWKLQEKAMLFSLIRDNKHSLELLQEIEKMDPQQANEPNHLKLCIENYVEMEQYEKASTFVEMLDLTSNSTDTMGLFDDKQYVLKIYLNAACKTVVQSLPVARQYFRDAFQEAMKAYPEEVSSSEFQDTDASEDSMETWDVSIAHDPSSRTLAIDLAHVLNHICGLTVPIMDRDIPPNRLENDGEIRIHKNSRLVVVLAGGDISRRLRLMISSVVKRLSLVTMLVEGDSIPDLLIGHRSLACSTSMMDSIHQIAAAFPPTDVPSPIDVSSPTHLSSPFAVASSASMSSPTAVFPPAYPAVVTSPSVVSFPASPIALVSSPSVVSPPGVVSSASATAASSPVLMSFASPTEALACGGSDNRTQSQQGLDHVCRMFKFLINVDDMRI